MKRWFLAAMLLMMILPAAAMAELEMIVERNYIKFPELDGMNCRFRPTREWTVVHRDNLDEHLDLLLQYGWTEEEIRARFAEDTRLWEAYWEAWPKDSFIRMERFTDDISRDIWHLRHLSTAERRDFLEFVNEGSLFAQYDTFSAKFGGTGGQAHLDCGFTTVPPADYESGRMCVKYINGQAYVVTYVARGRMASHSSLRTKRVNEQLIGYTPLGCFEFSAKLQPRLAELMVEALPETADVGSVQLRGKMEAGGSLAASLNGQPVPAKTAADGTFSLTLPLEHDGLHELILTATHPKYTQRTEIYTLQASASVTPLTLTAVPEGFVTAGSQQVSGVTLPGAEITLRLDNREAVSVTADASGCFSHTWDVTDEQFHVLRMTAAAPGREPLQSKKTFSTRFAGVDEAIAAFSQDLSEHRISELAENPWQYMGEKVKISVRVSEVQVTRDGLEVLCNYNPPASYHHAQTPLCLVVPGYARDLIRPDMIMTVYASVHGQEMTGGEPRLVLLVDYGTWLTGE